MNQNTNNIEHLMSTFKPFSPINLIKSMIDGNDTILQQHRIQILNQSQSFIKCFEENILKEYNTKNYLSFKYLIERLNNLNNEFQTFTKIPIILSLNIQKYNEIHHRIKDSFFGISNKTVSSYFFTKVGVLLNWFIIDNPNNEEIQFL